MHSEMVDWQILNSGLTFPRTWRVETVNLRLEFTSVSEIHFLKLK